MKNILNKINGKKTYIVVAITIVYSLSGVALGYIDPQNAFELVLGALGFAGVRNAIK